MTRTRRLYSCEYKLEAVRLVTERGVSVPLVDLHQGSKGDIGLADSRNDPFAGFVLPHHRRP